MWGRISTKSDKILGNMLAKLWHDLQESDIWGSILIITSVNDFNMWYIISLMIKENIPYPEVIYYN